MPDSCNYRVSDSAKSLSLPSEPPDIRNWFSSYAYESPELSSRDELEEAGDDGERGKQQEGEEQKLERTTLIKDKLVLGEVDSNRSAKYTNAAQDYDHTKAREVLGSLSDSLTLSPEAPHVERWFSSYIYDSPSLDTSIDFGGSESQSIEFDGEGGYAGKYCEEKEKNLGNQPSVSERNILPTGKKILPHGLATCNDSAKDTHSQLLCTDKAINAVAESRLNLTDLPNKKSSELIFKVKPTRDQNIASTRVRRRDLHGEDFIRREPINNPSSGKSEKSPEKWAERSGSLQGPAHTQNFVNLTNGAADKENKGNSFLENGFVSIKKEISEIGSGASSFKRSLEVPLVVNREYFPKPKPLSERTNFQQSDDLAITGKWKCPQKSKPNLGPPLKQLRLEQWVNRM